MVLDRREPETPPPPEVIAALDDPKCRDLLAAIDEPRDVKGLSESAEVPLSTTYRKIAELKRVSLVDERTEIRPSGHHRTVYALDFQQLVFEMDPDRRFGLVTLGSLLAGAAHQAVGLDVDVVLLIESSLVALGFGVITYSLYTE